MILMKQTKSMMMKKNRKPPRGWTELVARHPEYDQELQRPEKILFTPGILALISDVQNTVNNEFKYTRDQTDFWDAEPKKRTWKGWLTKKLYVRYWGDCEDYAIMKYNRLAEAGIPKGAMRFILCWTGQEYHLVLGVTGLKKTYILDNRIRGRYLMHKTVFYKWIMWSAPGQTLWENLE